MTASSDLKNVSMALDHLSQALVEVKESLNVEVAQAVKDGKYDTATAVIQFTKRLLGFQEEVGDLIGKWEALGDISDLITPKVRHAVRTRVVQRELPARLVRTQRASYKGITESTAYCFHILDVLEEMGGAAKNQDVSEAVNKRIKMLYIHFKRAKILMVQRGWIKMNGSNHVLEITGNGSRWLRKEKSKLTDESFNDHPNPRSENTPIKSMESMSENGARESDAAACVDEDFEQI